jgi:class 3 adenylate cyclase
MTPIKRYLIDLFSYSQAMIFVIFARKFIDLKKYYPIAFRVTNIYLGWYFLHFFIFQQFSIDIGLKIIWYPLIFSTFLILSIIFICAILRLKNGMELGKFFIIGMLPYFVFRLFFLLTILGIQSPFSYLPDSGIKYFLNSQAVTQAVGLFLEAIFMSLVLAKRTKFLQDNLNENIQKQAEEAEKQQVVLEETVKERTSELEEKSTALEGVSNQLAKYIPPQIHDALFAGKYDTEIKTQRRKLTVFFSDIRNFTSTSENLQPEDLTKYLNEYFSEMTKIAIDHGATIDKYIGDAMMVFFGDPETKGEREDARACVEMALKMQERMGELREKWLNEGFADPFEVRIGINTGYCNVGNFGSDQRLTYTIIGGEVNVAARLESAAQANGILMSYETYAHVQDMVEVEQKEAIKMKGINREIKIYAVEGRKEVVKTKAKPTKAKKPTKKELTEIEKLKEESKELRQELKIIRTELENIKKG